MRGGGNAAAQAVYWQAKKGVSFVVAFESERERNAAIMLARRFACDCNVSSNKKKRFELKNLYAAVAGVFVLILSLKRMCLQVTLAGPEDRTETSPN